MAGLEGAGHGFAFASGMAAEDALVGLLRPGDHVVLGLDAYGGTFRLIARIYGERGITWSAVDLTDPAALAGALRPETRQVWVETPTNPMLAVVDIAAVADTARSAGAAVIVDNTFATPYLQNPLALGADVVVHSSTKYLGGHSDVVGGFVATNDDELAEQLAFVQNAAGAVPSPFDCYLLLQGHQDSGRPNGPPLRQRTGGGRAPGQPPQGRPRAVPGHRGPSGPWLGGTPDAGLRGDGVVHPDRR